MNNTLHPFEINLSKNRSYYLAALTIFYCVIRFGFTQQLDELSLYSSYIFELSCVIAAAFILGKQVLSLLRFTKTVTLSLIISILAGCLVFKATGLIGVQVPFNLIGLETILFLLIVAPILEEAIFRFLLWQPIQIFSKRPLIVLSITSIAFSFSHFHAIWFVPAEMHSFIIYQSIYTLILGFACGFYVYRFYSLPSAILIHFGFNLGFYLGSQF